MRDKKDMVIKVAEALALLKGKWLCIPYHHYRDAAEDGK